MSYMKEGLLDCVEDLVRKNEALTFSEAMAIETGQPLSDCIFDVDIERLRKKYEIRI